MLIDPTGKALPCHAAGVIPDLSFDNVRDHPLGWLWNESPAFRRFRGEEWMPEPCRSCDRRREDFGGCRCQAMLLTGDPNATDPTCSKAPAHALIGEILRAGNLEPVEVSQRVSASSFVKIQRQTQALWTYRVNPK
jgi:pyrroloquinoline quinone biosynthesis protein E